MIDQRDLSRLPLTAKWLGFVEPAWKHLESGVPDDPRVLHTALIHANVIAQFEHLRTHPEVARALAHDKLQVHGWYYDILTGGIEAYDPQHRKFIPLDDRGPADRSLGFANRFSADRFLADRFLTDRFLTDRFLTDRFFS